MNTPQSNSVDGAPPLNIAYIWAELADLTRKQSALFGMLAEAYNHTAPAPVTSPPPAAPVAPRPPSPSPEGGVRSFDPLESLKASIGGTGVRWLKAEDRTRGAYALLEGVPEAQLTGEHKWSIEVGDVKAPEKYRVLTIDRNGSYFSACSNVPVSPSVLVSTGPMTPAQAQKLGGFFAIKRFVWKEDGPHPLGQISLQKSEHWIVTAPHLRLLIKLARQNRIVMPDIIGGWTGDVNCNVFSQFSKDIAAHQEYLEELGAPERIGEFKRMRSIAIRMMWASDELNSPITRPDWNIAVRAEASVRHWVKADTARRMEDRLIALESVDEAAFLITKDAATRGLLEPHGYHFGKGYAAVKVKSIIGLDEWIYARNRAAKARRASR